MSHQHFSNASHSRVVRPPDEIYGHTLRSADGSPSTSMSNSEHVRLEALVTSFTQDSQAENLVRLQAEPVNYDGFPTNSSSNTRKRGKKT